MRGLRSTLVLLVVLLCAGGYAYYISKKPAEDSSSKQEKVFGTIQADKIEQIRVKSVSGDTTTLKKENGEEVWKQRLSKAFRATPLVADGKIYFFGMDGRTSVVEANRKFTVVAKSDLADDL